MPLDLSDTVSDVPQEAALRLRSEGWPVKADVLEGPVSLIGDPTPISLVIRNMLENVPERSPTGTRLSVELGENGVVTFHDTGRGPSPRAPSDASRGSCVDRTTCKTEAASALRPARPL